MAETASEVVAIVSADADSPVLRQVYAWFADVVERVHDFNGFFICDFGVGGGIVLHGERGKVAFVDGIGAEELVFACA